MLNDEVLGAYLDGELPPERRAVVERAIAANRGAELRFDTMSRGDAHLRDAFAVTQNAKDPLAELIAHGWPKRMPRSVVWGRRAAAIAAACLIGVFAGRISGDAMPGSSMMASRGVAEILDRTPSGATSSIPGGQMQVALSLRTENGALCRQYRTSSGEGAVDALVCREGRSWRIAVQAAVVQNSDYRTAGAGDPIAAAIDGLGGVSVLSAAEEANVIAQGWRATP